MSVAIEYMCRARRVGPLAARIAGAIFGGYALGALASVAALALPISAPQGVITGMLASFVFYAGAVIWVFLARSARRAWAGLLLAALPLALAAWWALSSASSSVASATSSASLVAAAGGTHQ
ncbi:DUF3649 domain-containing protein [Paraburkholderia sp. JHI869]|uniref:DUF3649 domain-containing protein n=1 Tax=Paraburkholderia sp. JHI869 TaxID=3112959 RepID=UPI00316DBA85